MPRQKKKLISRRSETKRPVITTLIIIGIGIGLMILGYLTRTPPVVVTPTPVVVNEVTPTPEPQPQPQPQPDVVVKPEPKSDQTISGYNQSGEVVPIPNPDYITKEKSLDPDESGHHLRWLKRHNGSGPKTYFWRDGNGKRHWWPDEGHPLKFGHVTLH
jgi:hypothetical protein